MRLTPIVLSLAIAAATMASAGQGQRPDDQIDPRSAALVQQAQAQTAAGRYNEATDLLETALARRSAQPLRLYRSGPGRPGPAPARQGGALLCRCAADGAQRRQRARRPGRGLCPARRRRAGAPQSRAGADALPRALPAGAAARRGDPARPARRGARRPAARAGRPAAPPRPAEPPEQRRTRAGQSSTVSGQSA